jgi:hypothetical protein
MLTSTETQWLTLTFEWEDQTDIPVNFQRFINKKGIRITIPPRWYIILTTPPPPQISNHQLEQIIPQIHSKDLKSIFCILHSKSNDFYYIHIINISSHQSQMQLITETIAHLQSLPLPTWFKHQTIPAILGKQQEGQHLVQHNTNYQWEFNILWRFKVWKMLTLVGILCCVGFTNLISVVAGIQRQSLALYIGSIWVHSTWRQRQNWVSKMSCFK